MTTRIILTIALLGAIGLGVFNFRPAADRSVEASVEAARPLPVPVTKIEAAGSYFQQRDFTGQIVAGRQSEVGFELAGKLDEALVNEGDSIAAGQLLAQLDNRRLRVQLEQAKGQLREAIAMLKMLKNGARDEAIAAARANLENVQSAYDLQVKNLRRRQELFESQAVSVEDVDSTRSALQASAAQRDAAKAQLEELTTGTRSERIEAQEAIVDQLAAAYRTAKIRLEDSELRAPFAAIVTKRFIDEGSVINPGQPIFRLIESGQLEAQIGIPVDLCGNLQQGSSYDIHCGSRVFHSTLRCILPELDQPTQTRMAIFDLDAAMGAGPSVGEMARVHVQREVRSNGFWLPSTAIQRGQRGLWSAYVISQDANNDTIVERRDIEVLFAEEDRVFARGTMVPGEEVVTSGLHRLTNRQQVERSEPVETTPVRIAEESR